MKRALIVITLFIIVFLGTILFTTIKDSGQSIGIVKIKIGLAAFDVEVADTEFLQTKGLSGRDAIPANYGMLFVFPDLAIRQFWMKDVKFPLDIVWIQNDKVAGIIYGAQPESGDNFTIYESPEPVSMVLEVKAGEISNYGIKAGDGVAIMGY